MAHDKAHSGDCAIPEHLRGVHHDLPPRDQGRSYERERELIEAMSLDAKIRLFINRWSPKDYPRDFEADLINIVQRIYLDAQAPYVKACADAMARQPMPPLFFQGTKIVPDTVEQVTGQVNHRGESL